MSEKSFKRALRKFLKKKGVLNDFNKKIIEQAAILYSQWLKISDLILMATPNDLPKLIDGLYKIDTLLSEKLAILNVTPKNRKEKAKKIVSDERLKLIEKLGGKCQICGYDKKEILELHHVYPENKRTSPLLLVCPNCHREIHQGLIPKEKIEQIIEEAYRG